jgi:hypothetical protein
MVNWSRKSVYPVTPERVSVNGCAFRPNAEIWEWVDFSRAFPGATTDILWAESKTRMMEYKLHPRFLDQARPTIV